MDNHIKKRLLFPAFNTLIGILFGSAVGYYVNKPVKGVLYGGFAGFITAALLEYLLGKLGDGRWLYRRRVLLLVLLEIPLVTFFLGPFAYVISNTRPDHHNICCETPLEFGASEYKEIRIQTNDGISLAGWFVPPEIQPGPVIVILHGTGGDRLGGSWFAKQLIPAGYGVLLYDQRGLGESSGEIAPMSWLQGTDLLDILDYLNDQPEVDPDRIGIVGISGGAHISLNAAYLEQYRMKALWFDGLQVQRIEDFPDPINCGEKFALLINKMILVMAQLYFRETIPPGFIDILPAVTDPAIILVAGEQDIFESRVNEKYRGVLGLNADLWIIEGANHVGGPYVIPEEYSDRLLAFFEEHLD
ncbi:MAG: alpha/beta fold hydrolase [Anaerolineales bacterium]|nr:alpha/beta fold hydrolase [Anaerolineales bacterium]